MEMSSKKGGKWGLKRRHAVNIRAPAVDLLLRWRACSEEEAGNHEPLPAVYLITDVGIFILNKILKIKSILLLLYVYGLKSILKSKC